MDGGYVRAETDLLGDEKNNITLRMALLGEGGEALRLSCQVAKSAVHAECPLENWREAHIHEQLSELLLRLRDQLTGMKEPLFGRISRVLDRARDLELSTSSLTETVLRLRRQMNEPAPSVVPAPSPLAVATAAPARRKASRPSDEEPDELDKLLGRTG